MKIPWRDLAVKLGRWLLERGKEEAVKELEKRRHPSDPPRERPPQP